MATKLVGFALGIVAVAVGVFRTSSYWVGTHSGGAAEERWEDVAPLGLNVTGSVLTYSWQQDQDTHAQLLKLEQMREPVLVRGSPASRWPAVEEWQSVDVLSKLVPSFKDARYLPDSTLIQKSRATPYEDYTSPMAKDGLAGPPLTKSVAHVTAADFWSGQGGKQFYFSAQIPRSPFARFSGPGKPLQPDTFILGSSEGADSNVWAGSGAGTHTHYDAATNFFVQITGKKRFVLAPPTEYSLMNIYPYYHPRQRQARRGQEHLEAGGEGVNYSHLPLATAVDVILSPGDVLFLPPFWFHRTETLVGPPSLSVNIWSTSAEEDVSNKLRFNVLPVVNKLLTSPNVAALFLRKFAAACVAHTQRNSIHRQVLAKDFLEALVQQRYMSSSFLAHKLQCGELKEEASAFCLLEWSADTVSSEAVQTTDDMADEAAKLLIPLLDLKHGPAIAEQLAYDLIEWVVEEFVGLLASCRFLRCLADLN